jgi:C-terminal peptidase prc
MRAPMSPADLLTNAVSMIHWQYVERVTVTELADLALRELETLPPAGSIRVFLRDDGAVVTHTGPASTGSTLRVTWRRDATAADVGRALSEAGYFVVTRLAVSPEAVGDTLLRGLIRVDRAGEYLAPADLDDTLAGVGVEIEVRDNALVVSPIDGGPAARAGLRVRDRILAIDGVSTAGMQSGDAIRRLRGKAGSLAVLTVSRPQWEHPREITMTRERFRRPALQRAMFGRVGYVRIDALSEQTAREVGSAVDLLRADGAAALVLDLRDSPGGRLTAAVQVSELFLPEGRFIGSTIGRLPAHNLRFRARVSAQGRRPILDLPLAVLVGDRTSAGAEIIAAALQDWNRATVIGTRTAGHTSIMSILPLASGGAFKLTTSRWLTSNGRSLDGGLTPDVAVTTVDDEPPRHDPDRDRALRRGIELLARR